MNSSLEPKTLTHKLLAYTELIKEWQHKINIIGKNENIWERHIQDCLWMAPLIEKYIPSPLSLACLGSGAGLPGIVIAIALQRPVTLIESKQKKCLFLSEVKRKLSLDVEILCKRCEDVSTDFDGVMARGLAPLSSLLPLIKPLLKPQGKAFLQKGKNIEEEIEEADSLFDYEREKIMSPHDSQGCLLVVSTVQQRGS